MNIDELKALKEKHGHVRIIVKHDKSLNGFCHNMRNARRGAITSTANIGQI
jgi:ABC-type lipoprotein export system ATPase subunit